MPWPHWKDALRGIAWDASARILRHVGPPQRGTPLITARLLTADGRRLSTEAAVICALAVRLIDGGVPADSTCCAAGHFIFLENPPAPLHHRGSRDLPPGRARMPGEPFAHGCTWLAHLVVGP